MPSLLLDVAVFERLTARPRFFAQGRASRRILFYGFPSAIVPADIATILPDANERVIVHGALDSRSRPISAYSSITTSFLTSRRLLGNEHPIGPERAIICTNMPSLRVQIVRFVDEHQPGVVECQFRDADGQMHSIIGKLPYFTSADLWSDSEYPQSGEVECRALGSPVHRTVRIRLAEETTDGRLEVVVPETDLIA